MRAPACMEVLHIYPCWKWATLPVLLWQYPWQHPPPKGQPLDAQTRPFFRLLQISCKSLGTCTLLAGSKEFSSEECPFHLTRNWVFLPFFPQSKIASTSYSVSFPTKTGGGGNSSQEIGWVSLVSARRRWIPDGSCKNLTGQVRKPLGLLHS